MDGELGAIVGARLAGVSGSVLAEHEHERGGPPMPPPPAPFANRMAGVPALGHGHGPGHGPVNGDHSHSYGATGRSSANPHYCASISGYSTAPSAVYERVLQRLTNNNVHH